MAYVSKGTYLDQPVSGHIIAAAKRLDCLRKMLTDFPDQKLLVIDLFGNLTSWESLLKGNIYSKIDVHVKVIKSEPKSSSLAHSQENFAFSNRQTLSANIPTNPRFTFCSCPTYFKRSGCICSNGFKTIYDFVVVVAVDVLYHMDKFLVKELYNYYSKITGARFGGLYGVLQLQTVIEGGVISGMDSLQVNNKGKGFVIAKGDFVYWENDMNTTRYIFDGGFKVGGLFYGWTKRAQYETTLLLMFTESPHSFSLLQDLEGNVSGSEIVDIAYAPFVGHSNRKEVTKKSIIVSPTLKATLTRTFGVLSLDPNSLYCRTKAIFNDADVGFSLAVAYYMQQSNNANFILTNTFSRQTQLKTWTEDSMRTRFEIVKSSFTDGFLGYFLSENSFTWNPKWSEMGWWLGNSLRITLLFALLFPVILGGAGFSMLFETQTLDKPVTDYLKGILGMLTDEVSPSASSYIHLSFPSRSMSEIDFLSSPVPFNFGKPCNVNNPQYMPQQVVSRSPTVDKYCICGSIGQVLCYPCGLAHCDGCRNTCFRGSFVPRGDYEIDIGYNKITQVVRSLEISPIALRNDLKPSIIFVSGKILVLNEGNIVHFRTPNKVTQAIIVGLKSYAQYSVLHESYFNREIVDKFNRGVCYTHSTSAFGPSILPEIFCNVCVSSTYDISDQIVPPCSKETMRNEYSGKRYLCNGNLVPIHCKCTMSKDTKGTILQLRFIDYPLEPTHTVTPLKFNLWEVSEPVKVGVVLSFLFEGVCLRAIVVRAAQKSRYLVNGLVISPDIPRDHTCDLTNDHFVLGTKVVKDTLPCEDIRRIYFEKRDVVKSLDQFVQSLSLFDKLLGKSVTLYNNYMYEESYKIGELFEDFNIEDFNDVPRDGNCLFHCIIAMMDIKGSQEYKDSRVLGLVSIAKTLKRVASQSLILSQDHYYQPFIEYENVGNNSIADFFLTMFKKSCRISKMQDGKISLVQYVGSGSHCTCELLYIAGHYMWRAIDCPIPEDTPRYYTEKVVHSMLNHSQNLVDQEAQSALVDSAGSVASNVATSCEENKVEQSDKSENIKSTSDIIATTASAQPTAQVISKVNEQTELGSKSENSIVSTSQNENCGGVVVENSINNNSSLINAGEKDLTQTGTIVSTQQAPAVTNQSSQPTNSDSSQLQDFDKVLIDVLGAEAASEFMPRALGAESEFGACALSNAPPPLLSHGNDSSHIMVSTQTSQLLLDGNETNANQSTTSEHTPELPTKIDTTVIDKKSTVDPPNKRVTQKKKTRSTVTKECKRKESVLKTGQKPKNDPSVNQPEVTDIPKGVDGIPDASVLGIEVNFDSDSLPFIFFKVVGNLGDATPAVTSKKDHTGCVYDLSLTLCSDKLTIDQYRGLCFSNNKEGHMSKRAFVDLFVKTQKVGIVNLAKVAASKEVGVMKSVVYGTPVSSISEVSESQVGTFSGAALRFNDNFEFTKPFVVLNLKTNEVFYPHTTLAVLVATSENARFVARTVGYSTIHGKICHDIPACLLDEPFLYKGQTMKYVSVPDVPRTQHDPGFTLNNQVIIPCSTEIKPVLDSNFITYSFRCQFFHDEKAEFEVDKKIDIVGVQMFHTYIVNGMLKFPYVKPDDMLDFTNTLHYLLVFAEHWFDDPIHCYLCAGPGGTAKSSYFNTALLATSTKLSTKNNKNAVTYAKILMTHPSRADKLICGDEGATMSLQYLRLLFRMFVMRQDGQFFILSDFSQYIGGGNHIGNDSWMSLEHYTMNKDKIYYPTRLSEKSPITWKTIQQVVNCDSVFVMRTGGPYAQIISNIGYNNHELWLSMTHGKLYVNNHTRFITMYQPYIPGKPRFIGKRDVSQFYNPAALYNMYLKDLGSPFVTIRACQGVSTDFSCYMGENLEFEGTVLKSPLVCITVGLCRSTSNNIMSLSSYNSIFGMKPHLRLDLPLNGQDWIASLPEGAKQHTFVVEKGTEEFATRIVDFKDNAESFSVGKLYGIADMVCNIFAKKVDAIVDCTPGNKKHFSTRILASPFAAKLQICSRDDFNVAEHRRCPKTHCLIPQNFRDPKKAKKNVLYFIDTPTAPKPGSSAGDEYIDEYHLKSMVEFAATYNSYVIFKSSSQTTDILGARELTITTPLFRFWKNLEWYWVVSPTTYAHDTGVVSRTNNSLVFRGSIVAQTVVVGKADVSLSKLICPRPKEKGGHIEVYTSQGATAFVDCPDGYPSRLVSNYYERAVVFGGDGYSLVATVHEHPPGPLRCSDLDLGIFATLEFMGVSNFIIEKSQQTGTVKAIRNLSGVTTDTTIIIEARSSNKVYNIQGYSNMRLSPPHEHEHDDLEEAFSGVCQTLSTKRKTIPKKLQSHVVSRLKFLPVFCPEECVLSLKSSIPVSKLRQKQIKLGQEILEDVYYPSRPEIVRIVAKQLSIGKLPYCSYKMTPAATLQAFVDRQIQLNTGALEPVQQMLRPYIKMIIDKGIESQSRNDYIPVESYSKADYLKDLRPTRQRALLRQKDEPVSDLELCTVGSFNKFELTMKETTRSVSDAHTKISYHICPRIRPILEQKKSFLRDGNNKSIFTSGLSSNEIAEILWEYQMSAGIDYKWWDSRVKSWILHILAQYIENCYEDTIWKSWLATTGTYFYNLKLSKKVKESLGKLESCIVKALRYISFNGMISGGPGTTLWNSEHNEIIFRLAEYLYDQLWQNYYANIGDDGANNVELAMLETMAMIGKFLGMEPKIDNDPNLTEYNSQYLALDENSCPMLVPKVLRGLKRIYIEPRSHLFLDAEMSEENFGFDETFILQCVNYSECGSLFRIPVVREVLKRSVQLFGQVKVPEKQLQDILGSNRSYIKNFDTTERTMNQHYFNAYTEKEMVVSASYVEYLEKNYASGTLENIGEIVMSLRDPFGFGVSLEPKGYSCDLLEAVVTSDKYDSLQPNSMF